MADMKFYTVDSIAELFEMSRYTVRKWLRDGVIEGAVKVGGEWRVYENDLKKFAHGLIGEAYEPDAESQ